MYKPDLKSSMVNNFYLLITPFVWWRCEERTMHYTNCCSAFKIKWIMKRVIARIVYYFNPKYFNDCSYHRLDKWGIEDIFEGEIIWIE